MTPAPGTRPAAAPPEVRGRAGESRAYTADVLGLLTLINLRAMLVLPAVELIGGLVMVVALQTGGRDMAKVRA